MITAIILAAGKSNRIGGKIPKQFLQINNRRIIDYSIRTFEKVTNKIIIVVPHKWKKIIKTEYPKHKVIIGGKNRQESSFKGLIACEQETLNVLIHDAARPFVTDVIINKCIEKLNSFNAVTTVIKPVDTIVTVHKNEINNVLVRELCRLEQTPQAFKYDVILKAHKLINDNATDDIYLAYESGIKCGFVIGEQTNFKITNNIDLKMAKIILER